MSQEPLTTVTVTRRRRACLFSAGASGAAQLNAAALALFTASDDRWGAAAALGLRATLALVRDDLVGLGRDGLRSAALFHELGDHWGEF